MLHGSAEEIQQIKENFGAPDLKHNDDFMNLLNYGPQTYHGASLHIRDTWEFCDYVENAVGVTDKSKLLGSEGVGLDKAMAGYARWTKEPEEDWQTGSPEGTQTLVSRLLNKEYFRKTCSHYFPPGPNGETYGLAKGKTEDSWNARYGGWSDPSAYLKRAILVDGLYDPWRAAGYASSQRPGGILGNSTYIKHFVNLLGNHCTDMFRNAGNIWPEVKAIQEAGIDQIEKWIAEFPKHSKL
ncbi:hypothetical protein IL306_009623 [Fusarium sp. DS 682]|nr:hypothetical protein IL306_009623 [Fusarium sp. DS 682]